MHVSGDQGIDDIRTKVIVEIRKLEDDEDVGERVAWLGVYEDDGKPRRIARVYAKSNSEDVTIHTRYGFCYVCAKFLKSSLPIHFRSKHEGMSLPSNESNVRSWCDEVRRLGEIKMIVPDIDVQPVVPDQTLVQPDQKPVLANYEVDPFDVKLIVYDLVKSVVEEENAVFDTVEEMVSWVAEDADDDEFGEYDDDYDRKSEYWYEYENLDSNDDEDNVAFKAYQMLNPTVHPKPTSRHFMKSPDCCILMDVDDDNSDDSS